MGARKNKAVVERYLDITLSGDLDRLPEVVHAKVKGFDGEDKVVGLAAVRAYFEGMRAGLSKVRFKAAIVACDGEWVSVCGKTSGVHSGALMGLPASGKKISVPGSAFFRVKAGKIAEVRSFWDVPSFLKQTAMPPEAALALKRTP
jgi:steroid delta-isomerase-like uncharacterized protein